MKVFIIAALSADGFIGAGEAHRSFDWTSKEDKQLLVELSKEAGVIVMGSKTFNTFRIRRAPPGRRLIVYTRHPETVKGEGDIQTTHETPQNLIERLRAEGCHGLAIEGGSSIYKLFLDSGIVDELYLTIEPVLFGNGAPLFSGPVSTQLTLLENRQLNDNTVLLHYRVNM
ncbi:MAG TPA: dihydrofolate reductase family protein [Candidatus Saccharimonadales bacterium]|nr:dihydrofolate reductase family protein [Candidatus Saccharimonadales bacterium]